MKKREALELIYQELGEVLSGTNFQLKRNMEGFVRTIKDGWQEIGVPFYVYSDRFEFSLVMSIRIDAAEVVIHPFTGVPPEYRNGTVTAGFRLEYFMEGETRFAVTSVEETKSTVSKIAPVIRNDILPFLDSHQDIISLDKVMNRNIKVSAIPMQPFRGMNSIIIAKLANNPEFETIVTRNLGEMDRVSIVDKEKFNRLAEYLRTYVPVTDQGFSC